MNAIEDLEQSLDAFIEQEVKRLGSSPVPVKPPHLVPFQWPQHPVSSDYLVPADAWKGKASLFVSGESFEVEVAKTEYGVFGRCPTISAEAKGESDHAMMDALDTIVAPLINRQRGIAQQLGRTGRFTGSMRELENVELLRLFFSTDRSVANEAHVEVETRPHLRTFGPALNRILKERLHPHRRTAQWLVLDLYEELPFFFEDAHGCQTAITAIKDLMLEDAGDDFGRVIYKAGVVLGGHICTPEAGEALLEAIDAPTPIARRSAIHAVFHLAEWLPTWRAKIIETLRAHQEDVPQLVEFQNMMIRDIENEASDHVVEPIFAFEG